MFYHGGMYVLEALEEKPHEKDLIHEEIRQHLKRLEEEFAKPSFNVRHQQED